jgi:hypothetical protein
LLARIITILLLLAFTLQSFQKALILTDYSVNRKAYEKNCINKSRPRLKCHGRCQMMKKMQQEEKKDAQAPDHKSGKSFDQYCSSQGYQIPFFILTDFSVPSILACIGTPVKMPRHLLRPPGC